MSVATQILFNSPALHSLKRDQLVKLCKIHSLKANGKNKDLIERLQQHAKMLPPDDPLSIATRSDNPDAKAGMESEGDESEEGSDYGSMGTLRRSSAIPRPSEQWEVVMDDIPEVDEETLRSNRGGNSNSQAGEFGTNGGKGVSLHSNGYLTRIICAAPSVTSSLKSIVTSLGLKRNNSKSDNPTSNFMPGLSGEDATISQGSNPSVTEDHPPIDPIPGQMNLRGMPAPANARLSITQAPTTTTIRLVSGVEPPADVLSPPRLTPFETTFDLVPATPSGNNNGGSSVPVWPPFSPGAAQIQSIYPSLAAFQGFENLHKQETAQPDDNDPVDMSIDMPGVLAPSPAFKPTPRKSTPIRSHTGAVPRSTERPTLLEPEDIFSPAPKPANASARPRPSRSEPFIFGSPLPQHNLSNREFRSAAQSVLDEMNDRLAAEGIDGVNMNVLQNGRKQSDAEGADTNQAEITGGDKAIGGSASAIFDKTHQQAFDKMESIVQYAQKRARAPEPILSKKRKSSLVIKERKAGGAGRRRKSGLKVERRSAKAKAIPGGFGDEDEDEEDEEEEEEVSHRRKSKRPRLETETAVELETQPSNSGETNKIIPDADAEKEEEERKHKERERELIRRRLEYNKAKRRSSMGRPSLAGRVPPAQKTKPTSRFGFLSTAKSIVQSVWNRGASSSAQSQIPVSKTRKEEVKPPGTIPQGKKVAVVPGSSGHPPLNNMSQAKRTGGTASSRTSRAPIPTFSPLAAAGTKTTTSQGGHSRNGSVVGVSSLGMRARTSENTSGTSSMGKRTSMTIRHPASVHSENVGSVKGGATKTVKDVTRLPAPSSPALGQITNGTWSPQSPRSPTSKIFSQPLSPATMRPPMSLTAAAECIVKSGVEVGPAASSSSKPPIPPKPKVLPGRKPRISRSKVIARLASQRAAEATTFAAGASASRGKTRSSIGAGVSGKTRLSRGGAKSGDVLMSAKMRVRQSEYARRRSQATGGDGAEPMEVRDD
ncbi:hypothetical protein EDD17DRAFT_1812121 [Pisolithus thermaeus]|nr:hypothetical protein EV401DRAFT_1851035 [Pisolithus croceorrhizus]KAI6163592.1 hypothetical protein EDD17DRAFT_1812121 [Pisolithus thermaeus]